MKVDFNQLEKAADRLMSMEKFNDACAIYYFMADGDPSLDAGYLGFKIGVCYEKRGDMQAAKYWYGRAVDENPTIQRYIDAKNRLVDIGVEPLIKLYG